MPALDKKTYSSRNRKFDVENNVTNIHIYIDASMYRCDYGLIAAISS